VTYTSRDYRIWLLALALLAAGLAIVLVRPIPEPTIFRQLADERMLFGIANFWNVVSNAPFLIIGAWGLYVIARGRPGTFVEREEKWAYVACFAAVALIAVGSTYYHLAPLDDRLMWDRLPISLGFMALLAAALAERISVKAGLRSLAPLLVAGVASVLYWRWSGLSGAENILPYAIVQYGGIAAIVALAALFPSRYTRGADVLIAVAIYAVAKLAEVLDAQIYALGHLVSGHTLKHLLAALAVWWLLRMLLLRAPLSPPS
jgi:hypothetical protein